MSSDMNKPLLPNGWAHATLQEIAEINPKLDKSQYDDSLEVSFVPMPAVEAESGAIDVSEVRKFFEVKKGYTAFARGDVLFAKITPCMENGKMAVAPALKNNVGFGSTEFHVLRPFKGVSSKYIYYYLSSKQYRLNAEHNMTGAVGQRRVPTSYLADSILPIAPRLTQERVVEKIEMLFAELDKSGEALNFAQARLAVFRQAILNSAANGKLLVECGLRSTPFEANEESSLSQVVSELGQGWSPRCHNHPSPDEDTWGVIKTTAIQHLGFDETENKELPEQLEPRPHLEIEAGDLLITRAGPRKRVGVACLVRKCRPKLILCDKAYRLRVDNAKILPEYLEILLNSPKVLQDIEQLKTGINDSGVNLTQERFLSLQIFVPSIDEQKATLTELSAILSNIENIETQVRDALKGEEALRQSILKRAFSGKLVAQDPEDEPASVLLERIKTEKEAASPRRRRKTKEAADA